MLHSADNHFGSCEGQPRCFVAIPWDSLRGRLTCLDHGHIREAQEECCQEKRFVAIFKYREFIIIVLRPVAVICLTLNNT